MIRLITTVQELEELKNDWDTLAKVTKPSPFSTHGWVASWWKHFGAGRPLRVLTQYDNGRLVGIAPLYIAGNPLVKRLEFVGSGRLADYCDFIVRPDVDRAAVISRFIDTLIEVGGWQVMILGELPEWSPSLDALQLLESGEFEVELQPASVCPYVEIGGDWDGYFKSLSRNLTYDIERQRRRLAKLDDLRISFLDHADPDTVDAIIRLHAGHHRQSVFQDRTARDFLVDGTRFFAEQGQLRLAVMELSGRPIAFDYCIVSGGRMYFWLTGFDDRYLSMSPGKVLLSETIRFCFESGLKEFDFMRGAEAYKSRWTDKTRTSVAARLSLRGIEARVRRYADRRVRPLARKMLA